jgi:hypothetical protein
LSETSLNKEDDDEDEMEDDELMGEDLDMLDADEEGEEPKKADIEMINKKV